MVSFCAALRKWNDERQKKLSRVLRLTQIPCQLQTIECLASLTPAAAMQGPYNMLSYRRETALQVALVLVYLQPL